MLKIITLASSAVQIVTRGKIPGNLSRLQGANEMQAGTTSRVWLLPSLLCCELDQDLLASQFGA